MTPSSHPTPRADARALDGQLDIRLVVEEQEATLFVAGEVDLNTRRQFRDGLLEAQRSRRVVVDLSGVTFMDSGGVDTLMRAYEPDSSGHAIRVVGMRPNIRRVFEVMGLVPLLDGETCRNSRG